jgi:hypothetical protein
VDVSPDRALRQIALRQARRRRFNERLDALDPFADVALFRCECGLIACGMVLKLTAEEYADVRRDARQFVVHGEHLQPETDRVVERHRSWVMIASAVRHMDDGGAREQIVDPAALRIEQHR